MKYLDYELNFKNQDIEISNGAFEGYASVFGEVDQHQEIVSKGAFQNSLDKWRNKKCLPKMLWQHDPKHPIGVWQHMEENDYGLYVKGHLLLDVQKGHDAYCLLKTGVVDGLSIGFQINQSHFENNIRVLDDIELFEVSLVTFMANPLAKVTSCKNYEQNPYEGTIHMMNRIQALKVAMEAKKTNNPSLFL